jgi:hypothetical protein
MHAAETLSPSLLMAQMSAKDLRNFRSRRRSLGALVSFFVKIMHSRLPTNRIEHVKEKGSLDEAVSYIPVTSMGLISAIRQLYSN